MKKGNMILIGAATAAALVAVWAKKTSSHFGKVFKHIVPNQKSRACDSHGCGHFLASRGNKLHQGLDIIVKPGQRITSPINGKVVRYAYPYSDRSFAGIAIENSLYFIKIFYLAPSVSVGLEIKEGQQIGFAQNIAARYPNITPHVHMEVWDKSKVDVAIDPTGLFYT